MTGAVYDRGYRPYDGELGGRGAARIALWKASVRRALGLRRSWRQKVIPWALLVVVSIPAVVNVGVRYLTRDTPAADFEFITYRDYVGVSTALLLFVALTAPDVICPDRRQRVLPLIFARPLSGADYVLTKVAAIASIVFAFAFLPQVVLFVGQMLVTSDGALTYASDNFDVTWKVPVSVAALALYYAVLGVLAAALTTRRIIVGAIFLVVLLVSSVVASILGGGNEFGLFDSAWSVLNLLALPLRLRDLVFLGQASPDGPLQGIEYGGAMVIGVYTLVVGGGLTALLARYRWVDA